ncbi:MAG: response regulator [Planctomycetota bacterium]
MALRASRMFLGGAILAAALTVVGLTHEQRGSAPRELAAEIGAAAESTAATAGAELTGAERGALGESTRAALEALVRHPGVTRVTLLGPEGGPSLALSRSGPVAPRWSTPSEVPRGQSLGSEELRLTRVIDLPSGPDGVLVVEASFTAAHAREAEWIAACARMLVAVSLLGVLAAPLIGRLVVGRRARTSPARARPGSGYAAGAEPAPTEARRASPNPDSGYAANAALEATITALRSELEAVRRTSAVERAAFLINTAHEFRTPLQSIVTTGALLEDTELALEQRALVDRIVHAASSLTAAADDVLEWSAVETGTLVLESSTFDPEELLDEIADFVGPLARGRELEVVPQLGPDVTHQLLLDAGRLRRIVLHLVDNAVRYSERGVVEVSLGLRLAEHHATRELPMDGAAQLVCVVRDEGPGLPGEALARLTGDLASIEAHRAGVREGLGIGLALSARLARAMGGSLRVISASNAGTEFELTLPVRLGAPRVTSATLAEARVLVLDSQLRSAAHLAGLLRDEGANVDVETSTYAGFEALTRSAPFDLVFIAADLPGRDSFLGGVETLRGASAPKIVFVHPVLGRKLALQATDEAVAAQLAKPITRNALLSALALAGAANSGAEAPAPEVALASEAGPDSEPHSAREATPDWSAPPEIGPRLATGSEAHRARAANSPTPRVRVLLVDDNETNRQLVRYLLEKRGYQVDVASDGARALEAFGLAEYDAVLMDCQMPVMDGFEATRRIRALEQGGARRTPVLAMSAGAFGDDVRACLAAGMDDHLAKPFQPNEMLAWLEGWIARTLQAPSGAVLDPPRRRVSAREAGLLEPPAPLLDLSGALDESMLGSLLGDEGGRQLAEDLVATFLDTAPGALDGIGQGLETGDLKVVARLAHRFVSTSGAVGAVRLARLLREFERACEQAETRRAAELVVQVRGEVDIARQALQRQLGHC